MRYFPFIIAFMLLLSPAHAARTANMPPVPTGKPAETLLAAADEAGEEKNEAQLQERQLKTESEAEDAGQNEGETAPESEVEGSDVAEAAPDEDQESGKDDGKEQNGTKEEDVAEVEVKEEKPAEKTPYTKPYVGDEIIYTAKHEDTFVDIARKHGLGYVELRAANPYLDPWVPGDGEKVLLPTRHLLPDADKEGIVINLPEMRLYAFLDSYEPPVTHPLGIGREGLLTPTGTTSITRKKEGPTWRPTQRMKDEDPDLPDVVAPGPMNPLGSHALYLGWPTYAIHGTNRPYGIGRRVSSGCIRLYPEDIKTLFTKIPVGTKVTVVDQPIKTAWIDNSLYVEAHLTMEQADVMEKDGGVPSYEMTKDDMKVIMDAAGEYAKDLDWRALRYAIRERSGYPVRVFTKPEMAETETDTSGKS